MLKQISFLFILLFAACGNIEDVKTNADAENIINQDSLAKAEKIKIALQFINGYVENCNKLKQSLSEVEWTNSSNLATNNFKSELKRMIDEAYKEDSIMGIDTDPIFDAQYWPDKGFELDSIDNTNSYVILKGKDLPEFKLPLKMKQENEKWLVDGCGMVNIPDEKKAKR